jgi:hypothetical protein
VPISAIDAVVTTYPLQSCSVVSKYRTDFRERRRDFHIFSLKSTSLKANAGFPNVIVGILRASYEMGKRSHLKWRSAGCLFFVPPRTKDRDTHLHGGTGNQARGLSGLGDTGVCGPVRLTATWRMVPSALKFSGSMATTRWYPSPPGMAKR